MTSFPAAQVYSFRDLISDIALLGLEPNKIIPEPLMISARFTFTVRQTWTTTLDTMYPIDLSDNDHKLRVLAVEKEQAMRPEVNWEDAAAEMGWISQNDAQKAVQIILAK